MKIKCDFCGGSFNDTMEHCPNCGATNAGVVRTTASQPLTIEELQKWYSDRGLPPYEKTRFFIGENHRGPKAFGIYKDEKTGNFVVYKNKADGSRAVRYEGTDEAYAVNELFMRLKEEIIQQKRANVEKKSAAGKGQKVNYSGSKGSSEHYEYASGNYSSGRKNKFAAFSGRGNRSIGCGCGCGLAILIAVGLLLIASLIYMIIDNEPRDGYYEYSDTMYYYMDYSDNSDYDAWYAYDDSLDTWGEPINRSEAPEELNKNKTAKEYFISDTWSESLGCSDFSSSPQFLDAMIYGMKVDRGYYTYDGNNYYHLGNDRNIGWYVYDDDDGWYEVDNYYDIPDELTHPSSAQDFYYTPEWDESTQITDFEDTDYYKDWEDSYSSSSSGSGWSNSYDDDDYDWDDDDDWSSGWDSDWGSSSDWGSDWGTDWDSDW